MKVKLRHNILAHTIVQGIIFAMGKKFNVTAEKTEIKGPYIGLANHCSDYDVFFLAKSLRFPFYFVMSDHVSSIPFVGKLIKFLLSPIPITKSSKVDIPAIKEIGDFIKEGATVCIFPEGNKSCAGEMSSISKSIVKLIKHMGVPVVIYNIIGAYFSNPRWALSKKRSGKVQVKIAKVISAEDVKNTPLEDLYNEVVKYQMVRAYEVQDIDPIRYKGKHLAEGFQHMFYLCPHCNEISSLEAKNSLVWCKKCNETWEYTETGYLKGKYFKRLNDWDQWQKETAQKINPDSLKVNEVILQDSSWKVSKKITSYKSATIGVFATKLYKDRLELESLEGKEPVCLYLERIRGMALEGKNGIQITTKNGQTYRFGNKTCLSGIKYLHYIWALLKQDILY